MYEVSEEPTNQDQVVHEEEEVTAEVSKEFEVLEEDEVGRLLGFYTQQRVIDFAEVYTQDIMMGAKKLGEGAFGEVFRVGDNEMASVLKVIPFGGDIEINQEKQTTVEDILSEVAITVALSELRQSTQNRTDGFVEVRGAHVFEGDYPALLLRLWDQYAEEGETENDRPDRLGNDQKFVSLEFNNAGRDLEKYVFKNASQAFACWRQVAHSLAVAEEEMGFEHRDLHCGNVLVKEVSSSTQYLSYKSYLCRFQAMAP